MPDAFTENLKFGRLAEGEIMRWLRSRGNNVMPVYEMEIGHGKGPQFYTPDDSHAAPDLLVIGKSVLWVESKRKSVFSWYRIGKRWVTGIDLNHYEDYQHVQEKSGWPVWLLFRHESSRPAQRDLDQGCPPTCPVGLFGNTLDYLEEHKSHESQNHGRHGMVYWAHGDLKPLGMRDAA